MWLGPIFPETNSSSKKFCVKRLALECKDDSSTLKFYMFFLPDTRWNFQIFGFSTVVAKNLWLLSWEPSLCATVRKQQYGCGERSELHSTSHSYSQQKYTIGLPYWKILPFFQGVETETCVLAKESIALSCLLLMFFSAYDFSTGAQRI